MNGWAWLLGAALAAVGAYLAGWPAWSGWQARRVRDLNAERYLAWRGRATRAPIDEGLTRLERRRLLLAAGLALVALFCLVGFFTYA